MYTIYFNKIVKSSLLQYTRYKLIIAATMKHDIILITDDQQNQC